MGNAVIGKCPRIGKGERKRESGALMNAGVEPALVEAVNARRDAVRHLP